MDLMAEMPAGEGHAEAARGWFSGGCTTPAAVNGQFRHAYWPRWMIRMVALIWRALFRCQ